MKQYIESEDQLYCPTCISWAQLAAAGREFGYEYCQKGCQNWVQPSSRERVMDVRGC